MTPGLVRQVGKSTGLDRAGAGISGSGGSLPESLVESRAGLRYGASSSGRFRDRKVLQQRD